MLLYIAHTIDAVSKQLSMIASSCFAAGGVLLLDRTGSNHAFREFELPRAFHHSGLRGMPSQPRWCEGGNPRERQILDSDHRPTSPG